MNSFFPITLFHFRYDLDSVSRDGYTWDYWIGIELTWTKEWSFGHEDLYYDGPIDLWHFGPLCLTRWYDSSYRERRSVKNVI